MVTAKAVFQRSERFFFLSVRAKAMFQWSVFQLSVFQGSESVSAAGAKAVLQWSESFSVRAKAMFQWSVFQ